MTSGLLLRGNTETCKRCAGTGRDGDFLGVPMFCAVCNGRGRIRKDAEQIVQETAADARENYWPQKDYDHG